MAHSAFSLVSAPLFVNCHSSVTKSLLPTKINTKIGDTKSWNNSRLPMNLSAWNAKPKETHQRICSALQQAVQTKVPVSPLSLEDPLLPPINIFPSCDPHTATVISNDILVEGARETHNIVIKHGGPFRYWEGQVLDVIYEGQGGHYYFLATSRYGDHKDGNTTTLCVRCFKHNIVLPDELGVSDEYKTVDNYLCHLKPGDPISIAGPYTHGAMLLPYNNATAKLIWIASNIGVAPARGQLRRLFHEDIKSFNYNGQAWLIQEGQANSILYSNEFEDYQKKYPKNFRYTQAYLDNVSSDLKATIIKNGAEIARLLDTEGAYVYISGFKSAMKGVDEAFGQIYSDWNGKLRELKQSGQWREEVF